MQKTRIRLYFLFVFVFVLTSLSAVAQKVIATVPVGPAPIAAVVNGVTNKIYISNWAGASVTVIDGATNNTTTVQVPQIDARAIAVNTVTNKIFVADDASNTLTVIDGATLSTTPLTICGLPTAIAVNEVTNKIYVSCSESAIAVIDGLTLSINILNIQGDFTAIAADSIRNKIYALNDINNAALVVIDGSSLQAKSIPIEANPYTMTINATTNKIYVAIGTIFGGDTVTVIDGATFGTTDVTVGQYPVDFAVDTTRNKIYVSCQIGIITVIDGATNHANNISVTKEPFEIGVNPVTDNLYVADGQNNSATVIDGQNFSTTNVGTGVDPDAVAVNGATDRIYIANYGDDTVSVIDGTPPTPWQFVPMTPCRLVDTRPPSGSGPIQGGTAESFPLPQEGSCGSNIPSNAAAYSLNVTAVPHGKLGYLTIWPTGQPQPTASLMNSPDGRTKANAAIVAAGTNQAVSIYVSDTSDVVLDINGYFTPLPNPNALAFYPLTPCRVADTRDPSKPQGLGPPSLSGGVPRDFPVLKATTCNIPNTAQAYSMNFTAIPPGRLGYLTVWPAGETQPLVSTLNDLTGTVVANAGIVPAGTGGDIDTYASQNTGLVIDINGYFAPPAQGGLSLYSPVVCRVLDTRNGIGAYSGTLVVNVVNTGCSVSSLAQGFVFNATVVPSGPLGYLTLWPDGEHQPGVSTLNARDGFVTSNMAIVPNVDGSIDAYASALTQLILDIYGYYAP